MEEKKLNYEVEYRKKIQDNLLEIKKNLNKEDYKNKIKKWCSKFAFDYENVFDKANDDEIFRACFAKDPVKQNIYETLAGEFIKKIDGVINFEKLPTGGKNALFLDKQSIRKGKDFGSIDRQAKSIDFKFKYKNSNYTYYVFHKYTNESGGGQDNQYRDIRQAIESGNSPNHNKKIIVFFVCDGKYYTNKKIQTLKNIARVSQNFYVLRINELESKLKETNH